MDVSPEVAEQLLLRLSRHLETLFLVQPITETVMDQACAPRSKKG